jgi:hypothetical protein
MKLEMIEGKCFVMVSNYEAVQLIQSLTNQLLAWNPNVGRLESRCKGDATDFTIMVVGKEL